jgi:hypothetical protein
VLAHNKYIPGGDISPALAHSGSPGLFLFTHAAIPTRSVSEGEAGSGPPSLTFRISVGSRARRLGLPQIASGRQRAVGPQSQNRRQFAIAINGGAFLARR